LLQNLQYDSRVHLMALLPSLIYCSAVLMPDDGLLFLGSTETVLGILDKFNSIPNFRGLYQVANANEDDSFEKNPAMAHSEHAG